MNRIDGRALDEIRRVEMLPGFTKFAEGSCLISCGDTMVLCNASVEEKVPSHVEQGGWITAEYSMLPRANRERSRRDVSKLKLSPRSAEIQRLIGRSLRSAVDLSKLEGISITVDCDVLQGDGGTRTASVTGGFVALVLAFRSLIEQGKLSEMPVKTFVSGISAGVVDGVPMLDLQYSEDSRADVDLNCIMDGEGNIIEVQGTGEGRPFNMGEALQLLELCQKGNQVLQQKQKEILGDLV
jgi:ribonuclease PH